MHLNGKAPEIVNKILEMFENEDSLPEVMSDVLVDRYISDKPMHKWSWTNKVIAIIVGGTNDARGFGQWKKVGRHVIKGTSGFPILAPVMAKFEDDDGKIEARPVAFKGIVVHPIYNTEVVDQKKWDKYSNGEADISFIKELPFLDVAQDWGLSVESMPNNANAKGYYSSKTSTIGLSVKNLSTWAHEMVHASDDRLGNLTKGAGQQQDNEIVAELGGAALLKIIGYDSDADLGGAYRYIMAHCDDERDKALRICQKFINRCCDAVDNILSAAYDKAEDFE